MSTLSHRSSRASRESYPLTRSLASRCGSDLTRVHDFGTTRPTACRKRDTEGHRPHMSASCTAGASTGRWAEHRGPAPRCGRGRPRPGAESLRDSTGAGPHRPPTPHAAALSAWTSAVDPQLDTGTCILNRTAALMRAVRTTTMTTSIAMAMGTATATPAAAAPSPMLTSMATAVIGRRRQQLPALASAASCTHDACRSTPRSELA